jgi:hypothetical protein
MHTIAWFWLIVVVALCSLRATTTKILADLRNIFISVCAA